MNSETPTKEQIVRELGELEPTQWREVLDFIGYIRHREGLKRVPRHRRPVTARDLLQSGLVDIWADRDDIEDNVTFARELRQQAEQRRGYGDDTD